ncbi:hypothetical protein H4S07_006677, partial [Coemansia furcata]
SVTVTFAPGGAPHGGGHCEFSLSYDGGNTFVVVYQVLSHCFGPDQSTRQYTFGLPSGLPSSDKAVFAWTWVNAIGNREFYMNCADVAISGGSASYTGKQMTIANHNGYPTIPEFSGNFNTGLEYYNNATTITVSGSGGSSSGGSGSGGQYNGNTNAPVAHAPMSSATYSTPVSAAPIVADTSVVASPTYMTPAGAYSSPLAISSTPPVVYSTAPQPMATAGPVVPTALPAPYSAPSGDTAAAGSCSDSALRCSPSGNGYQYCLYGSWSPTYSCAPGTACKTSGSSIACDWP